MSEENIENTTKSDINFAPTFVIYIYMYIYMCLTQ